MDKRYQRIYAAIAAIPAGRVKVQVGYDDASTQSFDGTLAE